MIGFNFNTQKTTYKETTGRRNPYEKISDHLLFDDIQLHGLSQQVVKVSFWHLRLRKIPIPFFFLGGGGGGWGVKKKFNS